MGERVGKAGEKVGTGGHTQKVWGVGCVGKVRVVGRVGFVAMVEVVVV